MAKKNKKKAPSKKIEGVLEEFGFGTRIQHPNVALAENNIMMANAMAKSDTGLTQALDIVGGLAQQVGGTMMKAGASSFDPNSEEATGFDKFLAKNGDTATGLLGMLQYLETGGTVGTQRTVEVEGDEVAETPDGSLLEFKGPSHEDGGIKTTLPVGTDVFSDRLKVEGKTMAERKKDREKKAAKAQDLFNKSGDQIARKTLERILHGNKIEEDKDMMIQQAYDQVYKASQGQSPTEEKAMGGPILPYVFELINNSLPEDQRQDLTFDDDINLQTAKIFTPGTVEVGLPNLSEQLKLSGNSDQFHTGNNDIDYFNSEREDTFNALKRNAPKFKYKSVYNPVDPAPTTPEEAVYYPQDNTSEEAVNNKQPFDVGDIFGSMTSGDVMGMLGNYMQVKGAKDYTLAERNANLPNQTFYDTYGDESINKLEGVKDGFRNTLDQNLSDLELSRNTAVRRNNNSARGINTMRALNIATDNATDANKSKAYANYMQMIGNVDSKIADTQLNIDGKRAEDKKLQHEANQKDIAAFYQNMQQNAINEGKLISSFGQAKNKWQQDSAITETLKSIFPNFKIDPTTGKISGITTKQDDTFSFKTPDYVKGESYNVDQGAMNVNADQLFEQLSAFGKSLGYNVTVDKPTTKKKK